MSNIPEINKRLARCKEHYDRISSILATADDSGTVVLTPAQVEYVDHHATAITRNMWGLDEMFSEAATEQETPVQQLPASLLKFYRNVLHPYESVWLKLSLVSLAITDNEMESGQVRLNISASDEHSQDEMGDDSVRDFIVAAVDDKSDEVETLEPEVRIQTTIKRARRLCQSRLFQPCVWVANMERLEPVLIEREEIAIPSHVRVRLRELYTSKIFGNVLSVISLARSLLEYMIIDRAHEYDVQLYETNSNDGNRMKTLRKLSREMSEVIPELDDDMERIVENGNSVLHPRKGNVTWIVTGAIEKQAEGSMRACQRVAERLYGETRE